MEIFKSPLTPLFQRGGLSSSLWKREEPKQHSVKSGVSPSPLFKGEAGRGF